MAEYFWTIRGKTSSAYSGSCDRSPEGPDLDRRERASDCVGDDVANAVVELDVAEVIGYLVVGGVDTSKSSTTSIGDSITMITLLPKS